ncbi:T-cell immunoglobulin and mucin domain-containing protein 4-like [Ranitomeya imitator]|uniref:T-cell immunoglobulin and mucin domain-containing protein 4-like n=1 Tax=Ranitomeya imitator TaxID=111125 RepID=UPI0037E955BB
MRLCTSWRKSLQVSILLLLSSVTVLCQRTVVGIEGQPVTLPCSYKVKQSSDLTSMCWGKGSCPNSKCNQELIWTDGSKVTFRSSSRYQLNGRIRQGTVSLTIDEASLNDAGTYCCRIEHSGWFNDEKINIRLTVEKAPTTTVRTTTPTPTTKKTTQAPTTKKTTQALTTKKTTQEPTTKKTIQATSTRKTTPEPTGFTTTPEPSYIWTNPFTIPAEETTQLLPSVLKNTSPALIRPDTLPSLTAKTIDLSSKVFPLGSTEHTELTARSTEFPAATTENESITDEPSVVPNFIPDHHELPSSEESKEEDQKYIPLLPESVSPNNNGISDLFQGNVTKSPKKDTSTVIIAISLSVIVLIVICVILLQLKGRKRVRYLLGFDPRLELVTQPLTELPTEEKDPERDEDDRAETNHIRNISEAADDS